MKTQKQIKAKLKKSLSKLSKLKTLPKITTYLQKRKIKGKAGYEYACPIAMFLHKEGFKEALVSVDEVDYYEKFPTCFGGTRWIDASVPLPNVLCKFVSKFDESEHAETDPFRKIRIKR